MSSASAAVSVQATTGGVLNPLGSVVRLVETFGAARRCAASIRAGRRPVTRDLEILDLKGLEFANLRD